MSFDVNADHSGLPSGWWNREDVKDAYAAAADDFLAALPPYPEHAYQGRGIVIAAGGKYLPSAYVTIRAIRHVGCTLPVQVWYFGRNGEIPDPWPDILSPWGVECVDADAVRRHKPMRILNGYEIKPFATVHSSFREVLYLDADCYPCRNPEMLFDEPAYRQTGAVFWPDLAHTRGWVDWNAFRVQPDGHPPHETGQYLIDKRKWWDVCNLALWYNGHSDFTYRFQLGDKELLHVAAAKLHRDWACYRFVPHWVWPGFIHDGPDLQPLFVHRPMAKFTLEASQFYTKQQHAKPPRQPALPLDAECFGWLEELRQIFEDPADRCRCAAAGFCSRWNRQMSKNRRHLCATRPDYRRAWERQANGIAANPVARLEQAVANGATMKQPIKPCGARPCPQKPG